LGGQRQTYGRKRLMQAEAGGTEEKPKKTSKVQLSQGPLKGRALISIHTKKKRETKRAQKALDRVSNC